MSVFELPIIVIFVILTRFSRTLSV
jgi:hypothetical protein